MSRIGKQPIIIPDGIKIINSENKIEIIGKHGKLYLNLPYEIKITLDNNELSLKLIKKTKKNKGYLGLYRTLIQNMVNGVSTKFIKKLEIRGVGYRAQLQGKNLLLNMGFSHPIIIIPPDEISFNIEENTKVLISGIDKILVGQIAAQIRQVRPPESYKGKGIRYEGEIINLKVGKSAK